MVSDINDLGPHPSWPVADTLLIHPNPIESTSFLLCYLSPPRGGYGLEKNATNQWRFPTMGPDVCPLSGPPASVSPFAGHQAPLWCLEEASERLLWDPPRTRSESESEVAQSCPTLCNSMDCSLPGSSIPGIFQARILEWVAISLKTAGTNPTEYDLTVYLLLQIADSPVNKMFASFPRRQVHPPPWSGVKTATVHLSWRVTTKNHSDNSLISQKLQ